VRHLRGLWIKRPWLVHSFLTAQRFALRRAVVRVAARLVVKEVKLREQVAVLVGLVGQEAHQVV
jgi:hypothetical protein